MPGAELGRRVSAVLGEPRAVILVDGRSGSGKSTLARRLVDEHPSLQLVRLDDLYPGWDGLAAGSRHVVDYVLDPVRPRWLEWDWAAGAPTRWHELSADAPLLVEGVGAISRASRARASLAIWVDTDDDVRRRRALDRDGAAYEPHWERWAAQEAAFLEREHPRKLADVVIAE
ncbi:AAA family ATPase [Salinibacterium soli]|uniref:AAA family ATPase n=1 Tax=Antiquaquibacter soli TaxID=3064523 RepID=A0ABT9BN29_9MICO|nr:AAA family ATPase [Protaetiibacter sp. WY-16]MDO7882374.1 AAA family ATPase [Protaetiibacter sp. WY-16]